MILAVAADRGDEVDDVGRPCVDADNMVSWIAQYSEFTSAFAAQRPQITSITLLCEQTRCECDYGGYGYDRYRGRSSAYGLLVEPSANHDNPFCKPDQ
jgi:hypothetical protein